MHQRVVKYKDFNDQEHTDTLEFHISESRLMENWDIVTELEAIQEGFKGIKREMTPAEIKRIVLLVKRVARLGYGIRSDDGLRFRQKDSVWEEFEESAAYNAFLLDLFTASPDEALAFVAAIFPDAPNRQDLKAKARELHPELFEDEGAAKVDTQVITPAETDISQEPVITDDRPAWIRENREPTNVEIQSATKEELQLAYQMRSRS